MLRPDVSVSIFHPREGPLRSWVLFALGQGSCKLWRHTAHGMAGLIFLSCFILPDFARGQPQPIRRVLILNEVGVSYPLINLVDEGIRTSLENSGYRIEFYREYFDTTLFPDVADQQSFRDFYVRKYQNHKPDVIITVGSTPLQFMVDVHSNYFPSVPTVFCLPSGMPNRIVLDSHFTGVGGGEAGYGATIAAALRLMPDTTRVVVVGGQAPYDRQQQATARDQLKMYQDRIEISYLTELDTPSLVQRLKQLPSHTIVLVTALGRDAVGATFTSAESGPMIVHAANAPVFSTTDRHLDHGEVGGNISSGLEQGRIAGGMALRLLRGERAQDIPVVKSANRYIFDWRALKRWRLRERDLPPGSIVMNRQPTVWGAYKWYLVGSISLLIAESLLIFALLWQRVQRRKAQIELGKSEKKFSKAFQRSPLAFTLVSLVNYRFVEVNDTFERYTGWKRDEVVGRTPLEINLWVDTNQRSIFIEQLRAQGAVQRMEHLFRAKDGHVWTGLVSSELIDLNGEPCALSLIADITETKRAEEAKRESEERFRLVANTAPVMIWMAGTDKLCNYFNQSWLEFTGRSFEEESGNGWAQGVHSEDLDHCWKTYMDSFEGRQSFKMQYRLRRHDGEYRWILDFGVPRFNPDGSFAGYIGSCVDITERKLAEEALADMGRKLIEAQEEERRWIARELHDDINQQVAIIAVEMDQWGHDLCDCGSEGRKRIRTVHQRLSDLGRDVQSLSHHLHSSKLEYLGLAAAAGSFCKEFSEQHKVEVDFHCREVPRHLPRELSLCLFRVLQESLQNAMKHSGVCHFTVDLHGRPGEIQMSVSDRGVGFVQQDTANLRGLGLISMRERLQMVNGNFSVKSKLGSGTTIQAVVPVTSSHHTHAA